MTASPQPFAVKDCALAAIATGVRAQNARELHDRIQSVPSSSIFHHFWGGLLQPRFGDREYNNDFATWARLGLHDVSLAERLGLVDPAQHTDMEGLRREVVDVIEDHLYGAEYVPWAERDQQFHFMRSQVIVFDTHYRAKDAGALADLIPQLSSSSIFYHFVDARRRNDGHVDDFRAWLSQWGRETEGLVDQLADVDPYFVTLTELRDQVGEALRRHVGEDGR